MFPSISFKMSLWLTVTTTIGSTTAIALSAPASIPKKASPKSGEVGSRTRLGKPNKVAVSKHLPLSSSSRPFGVGLELGSNATYGNGITAHYTPHPNIDTQVGAGFNTTGMKLGSGAAFVLPLNRFGFDTGIAFVHSFGTHDKVSLPAKFTPEGSLSEESVTATRKFRVSPANYFSLFLGTFFDVTPMFRILGHVNYNKVQKGNNVEFDGPTEYDQPIDVSNDREVQNDFDSKAKSKLDISGLGFSAGVHLRF